MIPENIIKIAAELSFEEDADMIVGTENGEWVIRHVEDPTNETLKNRHRVNSSADITKL